MSDDRLTAEEREWLLGAMSESGGDTRPPKTDDANFLSQKITWDLFEKLFRSPIAAFINHEVQPWSPRPRIPFQPGETVQEALNRFLEAKKATSQPQETLSK